jgi:hypothetical protein
MRRLMLIAASFLFLTVPLWAQHGGGHASFGGHSSGGSHGFNGSHMSSTHSTRGSAPVRSFSSRSFSSNRGFPSSRGAFARNRFRGPRVRNFGFRNNCFAFGCRNVGFPWWGYDPWLWNDWNSNSSFDADYDNNAAQANEMNQQNLEEQRMFRQEEADGDRDLYSNSRRSSPGASNLQEKSGDPVLPPTVLVFRDQHRQEIQNYAIVGQTLWNFTSGRTQKVPLANLDLAATEKANDDRGVTFRVPTADGAE